MIRFALICDQGHRFDAWFASGGAYEDQVKADTVLCAQCGSRAVRKAPMAPAVKRVRQKRREAREVKERKETYALLKDLRDHLKANAENVGPAFAEQARKMHYGEAVSRSIYGEASLEEAQSLQEEGIAAVPLPLLPEDHN
jgi:hypothetical protein